MRENFFEVAYNNVSTMQRAIEALASGEPTRVKRVAHSCGLRISNEDAHALISDYARENAVNPLDILLDFDD